MSTNMYLASLVGNLMTYQFQIIFNKEPFDITNFTVEFCLKEDSGNPDSSGFVYTVGHGISVVNASLGIVLVVIPAADLGTVEAAKWFHLDIVDPMLSTNRQTAIDGILGVNTN